jgi:hypothetical protein
VAEKWTRGAWSVRIVEELRLHLANGPAVLLSELTHAVVAVERLRDRDVSYLAILGVELDQWLDVYVLLDFPQRRDEVVRHLSEPRIIFR